MTPVILLTDGYIANASELWPIPDMDEYAALPNHRPTATSPANVFDRDSATLARVWAAPGDEDYVYRVGGIEKDYDTGNISYDADNHQAMTDMRSSKIDRVQDFIPDQEVDQGGESGLAVVAWGSTYGTIYQAVKEALAEGYAVAHVHIRHIHPLPKNLTSLLSQYDQVLVPELNTGQLATLLRDKTQTKLIQLNKVTGQPLTVSEVKAKIIELCDTQVAQAG